MPPDWNDWLCERPTCKFCRGTGNLGTYETDHLFTREVWQLDVRWAERPHVNLPTHAKGTEVTGYEATDPETGRSCSGVPMQNVELKSAAEQSDWENLWRTAKRLRAYVQDGDPGARKAWREFVQKTYAQRYGKNTGKAARSRRQKWRK